VLTKRADTGNLWKSRWFWKRFPH